MKLTSNLLMSFPLKRWRKKHCKTGAPSQRWAGLTELCCKSDLNWKHHSDETGQKEDSLCTANFHQYAPTLVNSPRLQGKVRKSLNANSTPGQHLTFLLKLWPKRTRMGSRVGGSHNSRISHCAEWPIYQLHFPQRHYSQCRGYTIGPAPLFFFPFLPFLAWRQLPGFTFLQLMIHLGCFVVEPLQVPVGTFEGHFRLDAKAPKQDTAKVTSPQGCSHFMALTH